MPQAFYHERVIDHDGEKLRLVINFKGIDATEQLFGGRGYDSILDELQEDDCPIGTTGRVVWGLLREHHPEVTIDEAASLLFGETGVKIGLALSELLPAAFPATEKAKGANPPKPRGRSRHSTRGGAKPGSSR